MKKTLQIDTRFGEGRTRTVQGPSVIDVDRNSAVTMTLPSQFLDFSSLSQV